MENVVSIMTNESMTMTDIDVDKEIETLAQLDAAQVRAALRTRRQLMRLSQAEVGRRSNYASTLIARLETGSWYPRSDRGFVTLIEVAEALGLSVADLAGGGGDKEDAAVIFESWQDVVIVGEFRKFGRVVGLRLRNGDEFASLLFQTIEDRLTERWEKIGEDGAEDGRLQREREYVEALYQAVEGWPGREL